MKSIRLITVLAIACVVGVYTSCQKSALKPATTSTDAVAAQIALSLSKSLAGQYGGASINNGIKSPYAISHTGPAINGIYDLCGKGTDTTLNVTTLHHDTTQVTTGHFKFVYTCGSGGVSGYTLADSLNNAFAGSTFFNTTDVAQNYIVTALDQTYKHIAIDGSIGTKAHVSTLNNGETVEYHDLVSSYVFNGVTADLTNAIGDFKTGTAAYTTVQTDYAKIYGGAISVNSYHGLITYLGNYTCTITIQVNNNGNTDTYSVNMLTGAITKI